MKDRDVDAFDRRAASYESGPIGQMHGRIVESVADIALTVAPEPRRVLDIGCGTGAMLRLLADRRPEAEALVGIDPARSMLLTAAAYPDLDPRISLHAGVAEDLPFGEDAFDLLVSTTSFDHWADQSRGLAECARVLRRGAPLVLCDLFSPLLLPTLLFGHRGKARTRKRAYRLLAAAGFRSVTWYRSPLIKTVVAT